MSSDYYTVHPVLYLTEGLSPEDALVMKDHILSLPKSQRSRDVERIARQAEISDHGNSGYGSQAWQEREYKSPVYLEDLVRMAKKELL